MDTTELIYSSSGSSTQNEVEVEWSYKLFLFPNFKSKLTFNMQSYQDSSSSKTKIENYDYISDIDLSFESGKHVFSYNKVIKTGTCDGQIISPQEYTKSTKSIKFIIDQNGLCELVKDGWHTKMKLNS